MSRRIIILFVLSFTSLITVKSQTNRYAGWQKTYNDTLQGVNLNQAVAYLKAYKLKPRRGVIVGVIDSGIDTTCVDLLPALWKNPKEKPDGKDNDRNGYIDDLHGWNFLGTKDGSFNMTSAGTEEYREFKRLYPKYKTAVPGTVKDTAEYAYYEKMKKKAGITSYIKFADYTATKDRAYKQIDSILATKPEINVDTLTVGGLARLDIKDKTWDDACQMLFADMLRRGSKTLWKKVHEGHDTSFALMKKRIYGIEHDADKRLLIGDDMKNPADRFYGNNILQADGCDHGTFISCVIAGQGLKDSCVKGICPEARLMIIRAVPDGDEYDKDIASSIRYAVDNGAKVINMSLGKSTSPDSAMVTAAIEYARKKDVLIIQAAGNNHRDIDKTPYFPSDRDSHGAVLSNYLRVGASDRLGRPCSFSNYGANGVDVFAPGADITSVTEGNKLMTSEGTSIAAPIVSGVAAMIRMYFPKLTATQIKDILTSSVRPSAALKDHCKSGGVVDALNAVKAAIKYSKK